VREKKTEPISDSERRRLAAGGAPAEPSSIVGPGSVLGQSGTVGGAAIDPAVLAKLTPPTQVQTETSWSLGAALALSVGGPFAGVVITALSEDEVAGAAISIMASVSAGLLFANAMSGVVGAVIALIGPAAIAAVIVYAEVTSGEADPLLGQVIRAWFLGSLVPVEVGYVAGRAVAPLLARRPGAEGRRPRGNSPAAGAITRLEKAPDDVDLIDGILEEVDRFLDRLTRRFR
jgi:hypothetical protein